MSRSSSTTIEPLTAPDQDLSETVIEPTRGWVSLRLDELWAYRELVFFLIWRDIKVRYRQTILGAGWAVIQPFFTMIVFTVLFRNIANMPSDGLPYPIFSYAALAPWYFFSNGITQASNSLVLGQNLLKRVYFPRLAMPLAAVLSGGLDLVIALAMLALMMLYYGVSTTVNAVLLPALLLIAFATSLGVGLWLAAMNVKFRDVKHIVPFAVQLWLLATPIGYPSSVLQEPWTTLSALNPMAGVVEGFRWALLGADTAPGPMIAISAIVALLVLWSGLFYFRRQERLFADVA